jgi:hypothetical protein
LAGDGSSQVQMGSPLRKQVHVEPEHVCSYLLFSVSHAAPTQTVSLGCVSGVHSLN